MAQLTSVEQGKLEAFLDPKEAHKNVFLSLAIFMQDILQY